MLDWNMSVWNIAGMEKLKKYLTDNGLRQEKFGKKVGATQSTISKIISGKKMPSLEMALTIARETNGAVPAESWVQQEGSAA